MSARHEIGTWWINHFDDPREEFLCLQWLKERIRGYGRSDGRLYFTHLDNVRRVYLQRWEEIP